VRPLIELENAPAATGPPVVRDGGLLRRRPDPRRILFLVGVRRRLIPTAAVGADSGVPHGLVDKSAGPCEVVIETLAQAHHVVNGVADLSIELGRSLIRGPNLQVYFAQPRSRSRLSATSMSKRPSP